MPTLTAGEIADFVDGEYIGDRNLEIRGVRAIARAEEADLTFLSNPKYEGLLKTTRAGAVLVRSNLSGRSDRWIRVADPYLALARVLERWFRERDDLSGGVSPQAHVHESVKLGSNVAIAAGASVGIDCVLEDDVVIASGTVLGPECSVGKGTTIHPNVSIYRRTTIGRRCIVHAGVVIGSDGFGFATAGGRHVKIPQLGTVTIEDDVEIGAGTTIDRGALGETVIGEGTKIDNLVHIGHNVVIGKYCLIVAQVGIAGSSEIGDRAILAGQAGVTGHVTLGEGVQVAAQSAVMKSFAGSQKLSGSPARGLQEHMRIQALTRRLPEMISRLEALERAARILERTRDETDARVREK